MSAFYNVHDMVVFEADHIDLADGELGVSFWIEPGDDESAIGLAAIPSDPTSVCKAVTLTPANARALSALLLEAADRVENESYR